MCHEYQNAVSLTHDTVMLEPDEYQVLSNKSQYQYAVSVWMDMDARKNIINSVNNANLDLVTYIDDTVRIGQNPPAEIGRGTFVFAYCLLSIGSYCGQHCVISAYSMLGHYSKIGNGCILRPGVMITGKSVIGDNCIINTRATVTNGAVLTDNVQVMAFANVVKNINTAGNYTAHSARRQLSV